MAVFPSDSIRTKNWGTEVLTDADLESQLDLLHTYLQAALNSSTGHAHTGAANQGPKLSPANMVIASQAQGDTLYASSATAWARLAKGTASQVLQMKSDATIPEWVSSGVTDGSLVRMTTGDKLPAVDGSLLTGIVQKAIGVGEARTVGTVYQAATDGFYLAYYSPGGAGGTMYVKTDSSNPPTTIQATYITQYGGSTIPIFVKAGNYYLASRDTTGSTSSTWVPFS